MFGFRRREWKHAHKTKLGFFKELIMAACLVALIAGAWISLSGRGGKPAEAPGVTNSPSFAADTNSSSRERPEVNPPQTQQSLTTVGADPLDGLDPIATPEIFDLMDLGNAFEDAQADERMEIASRDELEALRRDALDIVSSIPAIAPRVQDTTNTQARTEPRFTIAIDKRKRQITVYRGDKAVKIYRVAVGKRSGDKERAGDLRTPEGTFPVQRIHNAEHWVHDFGDGNGVIAGAYGPLFIRLHTPPWKGIGIHGTHDPASLGADATGGCVRMKNDELLELAEMVEIGTIVTIK